MYVSFSKMFNDRTIYTALLSCLYNIGLMFTFSWRPKDEVFCGTVLNAQSCFVCCKEAGMAGICIVGFSSSEPPASTTSTVDSKSSESLLARTEPADPAPTTRVNQNASCYNHNVFPFAPYVKRLILDFISNYKLTLDLHCKVWREVEP